MWSEVGERRPPHPFPAEQHIQPVNLLTLHSQSVGTAASAPHCMSSISAQYLNYLHVLLLPFCGYSVSLKAVVVAVVLAQVVHNATPRAMWGQYGAVRHTLVYLHSSKKKLNIFIVVHQIWPCFSSTNDHPHPPTDINCQSISHW